MFENIFKRKNDYNDLFDEGLVEVKVAFTTRCSARCTTCLNHTICDHYDLNPEIFKSFVNQVIDIKQHIENPMYFSFFNLGESYLHPQFIELCEWALPKLKKEGIRTSIVTNGSHVRQVPNGIDDFFISFNAGKKSTYEEVTGLKYEEVRNNIIDLYCKGELFKPEKTQIHMLCFDSNKGEEDEFKKAFAELKGIEYRFSYKYDNQQEKTDHKGVAIKQGRVPCDYITNKINLYPNGDIHSCAHDFQDTVVFGNVKQEKLIKILKSKVRENMILEHKAGKFNGLCERCDYNSKIDNLNDWFVYGKFGE